MFRFFFISQPAIFRFAFHAKMGPIKDSNGTDLTEAGDIKRWQEYTEEEEYKKRSS